MTERGRIYRELGVEPVINATATVTALGGSLMRAQTVEAMQQAAGSFVDLGELEAAVSVRLAALTRNEACLVCGGAAAAVFLTTAACMTRERPDPILHFDDLPALRDQVIVHRAHRIPYDHAVTLARAQLVEIGMPVGTMRADLERAITDRTAMIFHVAGGGRQLGPGALLLADVVEIGRAHGVPVVVDAAAQIPPVESLWRYTEAGADLVIFSGGKGLRGPASTGLIFGRRDLVDRCRANAAPLQRPGRPMKTSKEDLVGILSAVELALGEDEAAIAQEHEAVVEAVLTWAVARADVTCSREFPSEAGQPMPRARIGVRGFGPPERDALMAQLLGGRPRIAVWPAGDDGVYINPQTLIPGEVELILRRLDEILGAPTHPATDTLEV